MDMEKLQKSKDEMMERNYFTANGFTFKIEPVYLGEEQEFLEDFGYSLLPKKTNEEPTDDDRITILMGLFSHKDSSNESYSSILAKAKNKSLFSLIKCLFKKDKTDYSNYYENTLGYGLTQWIEKKVTYRGKKVRFHEFERKYGLNKIELYNLLLMFMEISNFPTHLPKAK